MRGVGRERAVIFQEPRLLPWLTVLDNVAFGLETQGLSREEARSRARRYINLVGLQQFESAYPRQLSGGMAQRVALPALSPSSRKSCFWTSRSARWMR